MNILARVASMRGSAAAPVIVAEVPPPAPPAAPEPVAPPAPEPVPAPAPVVPEPAPAPVEPEAKAADPAAVAELCATQGCAHLAAGMIREGLTMPQVKARIDGAGVVTGLVASARKVNPALDPKLADEFIAAGASADHVRAQLFDKLIAAQSVEISHATAAIPTPVANGAWAHALKVNKIDVKTK